MTKGQHPQDQTSTLSLYRRGFLLGRHGRVGTPPTGWKRISIPGWEIHCDPLLRHSAAQRATVRVVVLGLAVDPVSEQTAGTPITDRLVDAQVRGRSAFLDLLDNLSGRFVVIVSTHDGTSLYLDAVGSRAVYYDTAIESFLIASHAELIADIRGYTRGSREQEFMNTSAFQNDRDSYFPGISTPYPSVKSLTPNTALELETSRVRRIFPRTDYVTGLALEDLAILLQRQTRLFAQHNPLAISLTAGLDSRLTLASAREDKKDIITYTTIYGEDSHQDAIVAKRLSHLMGVRHLTIEEKDAPTGTFYADYSKNTAGMSSSFRAAIAHALQRNYPEQRLHLKSNGSEICRAYYRQLYFHLPSNISPQVCSHLYGPLHTSEFVIDAFREYIETTGLDQAVAQGYDIYDLFYWEHRVGIWQGLSLYEWDIAQDSVLAFSNRRFLTAMMNEPLKRRLKDVHYKQMMTTMWPNSLNIPINPHASKSTALLKRIARQLHFSLYLLKYRAKPLPA